MIDVVVIGGGIIGGSVAWRLAQRGISVLVAEAGRWGAEASWAGAGMLAPGGEVEESTPWSELALRSHRLYPQYVAELQEESQVAIDYRPCGSVEVAYTLAEWNHLERRAERQQRLGIVSEAVPRAALAGLVPGIVETESRFYPGDAVVDPRTVMQALRVAATRRGVCIREGTRVVQVKGSSVITAAGDVIPAGAIVLAAGAWSGEVPVEGISLPPTVPVRGHLIGYDLAPGSIGPILRHEHTYVLQRRSGFTLAGTSTERVGFDRELDAGVIAGIRQRAGRLYPPFRSREPSQCWVGFRPATEALTPEIGRLGPMPVWLAFGHYRNGILLAPVTASMLADSIASHG